VMNRPAIVRLDKAVIDRIAAGEVVQRPSAALKELLENSLDAGATQIHVTVADAGLGMMQIRDDGSGIHKDDLPLLCERYATSKLRSFEELQDVTTFGFRGEALASLSHVSHVSVTTRTAEEEVGWEAAYDGGAMVSGPSPLAANRGTTITARDMFYNSRLRRQAFGQTSEEFTRICDVVTRYAMARPDVGFVVQKAGATRLDVSIPRGNADLKSVARNRFGESVAKCLVPLEALRAPLPASTGDVNDATSSAPEEFLVSGWLSNPNYAGKRLIFTLFVNGRLVGNAAIQRAVEHAFAPFLMPSTKPFVFLSVVVPSNTIDVNVHPTKHEVLLLHEEDIVAAIFRALRRQLQALSDASREVVSTQQQRSQIDHAGVGTPVALPRSATPFETSRPPGVPLPAIRERGDADRGAMLKFAVRAEPFALFTNNATAGSAKSSSGMSAAAPLTLTDNGEVPRPPEKKHRVEEAKHGVGEVQAPINWTAMVTAAADDSDDDRAAVAISNAFASTRMPPSQDPRPTTEGLAPRDTPRHGLMMAGYAPVEVVVSSSSSARSSIGRNERAATTTSDPDVPAATETSPVMDDDEDLESVATIRAQFAAGSNATLQQVLNNAKYVGAVDDSRILLQSGTTLYLVSSHAVLFHAALQRTFSAWRRLDRYTLQCVAASGQNGGAPDTLNVENLIRFALRHDAGLRNQLVRGVTEAEVAATALDVLNTWRPMLKDYFAVDLRDDAGGTLWLHGLPAPLTSAWPVRLRAVPLLLLRLAFSIDYSTEVSALLGIAREVALFATAEATVDEMALREAVASAVACPSFFPPASLASRDSIQAIVTVEALYKVFERC
jgi:DNA mismatch repair protein MLH1